MGGDEECTYKQCEDHNVETCEGSPNCKIFDKKCTSKNPPDCQDYNSTTCPQERCMLKDEMCTKNCEDYTSTTCPKERCMLKDKTCTKNCEDYTSTTCPEERCFFERRLRLHERAGWMPKAGTGRPDCAPVAVLSVEPRLVRASKKPIEVSEADCMTRPRVLMDEPPACQSSFRRAPQLTVCCPGFGQPTFA